MKLIKHFSLVIGHFAFVIAAGAQINAAMIGATVPNAPSADAGASWSDDFSSGSLVNWKTISGTWTIASGALNLSTTESNSQIIYTNTQIGATVQAFKVSVPVGTSVDYFVILFRANVTASEGYYLMLNPSGSSVAWQDIGINTIDSASTTVTAGQVWGGRVNGTGNSTEVRVWLNPTGTPSSANDWMFDGSPTYTWTSNPATAANTGTYIGAGGHLISGTMRFDNFFAWGSLP